MISYFLAFFWGIFILFSLIGWGSLINRIIFPKHQADWGLLAVWGLAFSIVFGGLLNVTWTISKTVILIYLGLGILSCFFAGFQSKKLLASSVIGYVNYCRKDRVLLVFTIIDLLLILIQYAGWISTDNFHPHDDFFGYFVFPEKMLQIGSLGADPFSGRRLISSLGGQSFLHTFILSMFNEENLHIIDPAIASIIVFGLILGFLTEKNFLEQMAAIILLPFILIIPPVTNTTTLVVGSSLVLGLFRTLYSQELKEYSSNANAFMIALITSATIATKSTFIPVASLLFGLSYFFYIINNTNKRKAIREFILATLITIALLLPWAISMYQSSGTLLFPLLGKGYHGSVYYEHYAETYGEIKWFILPLFSVLHVAMFFLCVSYIKVQPWRKVKREHRGATLSLLISVILGAVITIFVTNGYHERYIFSFVYVAIVVLIITLLAQLNVGDSNRRKPTLSHTLILVLVISLLIGNGNGWNGVRASYLHYIKEIQGGLTQQFSVSDQREIAEYIKMQQSLPPDEILLTRLSKPFLLNFSRNPVFIVDLPGYASPPPGMPLFKGSEALSDYLTAESIRYVAYDYAKEPGAQRAYWQKKLGSEIYPWVQPKRILELRPFLRRQIQYTLDFNDNLQKLGQSRKKVYDDGKRFVIDLLSREG